MDGATDVKTYGQVSEVLTFVQVSHRRMRDLCQGLLDQTAPEKIELLMDVFVAHEEELQRNLETIGNEQRQEVLATWVQYVPTRETDELLDRLEKWEQPTWDEVTRAALQMQESIAGMWDRLAEQVDAPPVREVLTSLADTERRMGRRLSNQLLSLQEM